MLHTDLKNIKNYKQSSSSSTLAIPSTPLTYSNSISTGNYSGPDTSIILKMQEREKNPLFKLSVNDYKKIYENKMIVKILAKIIDCEEIQLKKFCKYINIFFKNINLSSKSIKNKMKKHYHKVNTISLSNLPLDLRERIVDKYYSLFPTKYLLKEWIILNHLNWEYLSKNQNAIELLKYRINEEKKMDIDYLNNLNIKDKINWQHLSSNPNAIELLIENIDKIDWNNLSQNKNPKAIELLKDYKDKNDMNWYILSLNPAAIKLLNLNKDKIEWELLSFNSNAIELLQKNKYKINWKNLSSNPNAINILKNRIIYECNLSKKEYNSLKDKIDWKQLSLNPNAGKLLEITDDDINILEYIKNDELFLKNEDKIVWYSLFINQNAINLIEKNKKTIIWNELSANPNAIQLLKNNYENINWSILSGNPNAINLLHEKLIEENSLDENYLKKLDFSKKINWWNLSSNSNAIDLLKEKIGENHYKIDWNSISANPAIFEAK